MMKKLLLKSDWDRLAQARLRRITQLAQTLKGLKGKGPKKPWQVTVKIVGKKVMTQLNFSYRRKNAPTDVLSFPAEFPFRDAGLLGELIICLPVLKSQAKTLKHDPALELDVLVTHGVLHLLGLDHEKGPKEAIEMAKWEAKILGQLYQRGRSGQKGLGLINRVNLDMEEG